VSATPKPIRVLAVDDHPIVRGGIAAIVATQSDMQIVGEAPNGREAIELFRSLRPDVTLMDVQMQMPAVDGIDALTAIRAEFNDARVTVLTTYSGDVQALRALRAGAQAYLLKSLLQKELLFVARQHPRAAERGAARRHSIHRRSPGSGRLRHRRPSRLSRLDSPRRSTRWSARTSWRH
jgi:DNA-binding NarL/FixJ family response regulator